MLQLIRARLHQKYRTIPYPDAPPPPVPDRLRGRLLVRTEACPADCTTCAELCPVNAITYSPEHKPVIDFGRCLFCNDCVKGCPHQALRHDTDHRLAVSSREHLILKPDDALPLAHAMADQLKKLLGRSLKLRQVCAGGCNACEADVNVLGTVGWDLGRFGIQFVAAPRHADGILLTGPVTQNMHSALMDTYHAIPAPKVVIAVGACAIAGGPFIEHDEIHRGAEGLLPIDLYIPGCPPHPLTILDGLLRLIGRIT